MSFVSKFMGNLTYVWKGESCRKDLEDGVPDRDLIEKYGEYTVSKVKESLPK
jgi:hypothetical protein